MAATKNSALLLRCIKQGVHQSFRKNIDQRSLNCIRYFSKDVSIPEIVTSKNSKQVKLKKEADVEEWSWGWTPPTNANLVSGKSPLVKSVTSDFEFPVIVGESFGVLEITEALDYLGGINVTSLPIDDRVDSLDYMVFCTGRSPPHLRRLADILVRGLKKRKLHQAPGSTGAEGYDCDDWIVVDCGNILVHLMDEHTRRCLNLEHLWSSPEHALTVQHGKSEEETEAIMDELVANNPTPIDYNSKDAFIEGAEKNELLSSGRNKNAGMKYPGASPLPEPKRKGRKGGRVRDHANF